ncbi:E4 ORF1 [Bottlenose dolphin adenovirus 1]|uniref:E4 ORF1 n=1 Tax=Bottlenose dolphin adenovirus 1 TaxID=1714377 RepID=A0A1X7MML8_9ADEN|nr:E4 ORF1 [Bottlenose dolphin adenovirus 1]SMG83462.1 E4 ORF1 [Bottlenose dolphin adenovirus 1]
MEYIFKSADAVLEKSLCPLNCVQCHLGPRSLAPIICKNTVHFKNEGYLVVFNYGVNVRFNIGITIPTGKKALVQLSSLFYSPELLVDTKYVLFQGYIRVLQLYLHAHLMPVVIPRGTTLCEVTLID